jgi:hypothetical protein
MRSAGSAQVFRESQVVENTRDNGFRAGFAQVFRESQVVENTRDNGFRRFFFYTLRARGVKILGKPYREALGKNPQNHQNPRPGTCFPAATATDAQATREKTRKTRKTRATPAPPAAKKLAARGPRQAPAFSRSSPMGLWRCLQQLCQYCPWAAPGPWLASSSGQGPGPLCPVEGLQLCPIKGIM